MPSGLHLLKTVARSFWEGSGVGHQQPVQFGILKLPTDGVPVTFDVVVPQLEIIRVDLELGGGHHPMGGGIIGTQRENLGGVGGVFNVEVEMDDAVAAQIGGQCFVKNS